MESSAHSAEPLEDRHPEAVGNGDLAASEAASVTRVVEVFVKAFELYSFDGRLSKLERNDAQLPPRTNGTQAPTQP